MFANEDMLTETGRDPNKSFRKEETQEAVEEEEEPVITLETKDQKVNSG